MTTDSNDNPFASPSATDAEHDERPRLPLRRALLGLLLIPPSAAVAAVLLLPVQAVIQYAVSLVTQGAGYWLGFYATDGDSVALVATASLMFAGFNTLILGLPLAYWGWRSSRLTARGVLVAGGVVAAGWFTLVMAVSLPGILEFSDDDFGMGLGPVASRVVIALHIGVQMLFMTPLPLFLGVAAYAWWVGRLTKSTGGASDDALVVGWRESSRE